MQEPKPRFFLASPPPPLKSSSATITYNDGSVSFTPQVQYDYNLMSFKDFVRCYPFAYPGSEQALRKLYQRRFTNGFYRAFRKVSPKRVCVCPSELHSIARAKAMEYQKQEYDKIEKMYTIPPIIEEYWDD